MQMRDLHNHMAIAKVLGPVVLAADNTPSAIDLQGFRSAEIVIDAGIGGISFSGTNKIEVKVTHSDDDSTYTDVEDADMLGVTGIVDGIVKSFVAAHAAAASYAYGYVGGKRYLKVLADFGGTHGTGTPMAINVIKSDPLISPIV